MGGKRKREREPVDKRERELKGWRYIGKRSRSVGTGRRGCDGERKSQQEGACEWVGGWVGGWGRPLLSPAVTRLWENEVVPLGSGGGK